MSLKILFIGGSGEISRACAEEALRVGHDVTVFNRGRRDAPSGAHQIVGDVANASDYTMLRNLQFDVVCQFLAFEEQQIARDIDIFSGHCDQYIFISSASAYLKPWHEGAITEDTPLGNPFMLYSRNKAACEALLRDESTTSRLPVTIVRPSHTYSERLPSTVIDGDHLAWRIVHRKPVIVHDGGNTLWTLTRSEDFARAFTRLFANSSAIGEAYHITDNTAHTWNTIIEAIAELTGESVSIHPLTSETLTSYRDAWRGPLLGDKANNLVFNNSKISAAADGWRCQISLREGLARTWELVERRLDAGYNPQVEDDELIDRIIREQCL